MWKLLFFMNNSESFSVDNAYSESNSNGKIKLLLSVKWKKHKSVEMICFVFFFNSLWKVISNVCIMDSNDINNQNSLIWLVHIR